ncbi:Uu.00g046910.m01.CDS01 [Anthostomella pinea]|uniref:Uu.00g046910.m01.CDS01 n=1 Tax=Anthostomella pinea TaxID=933095 RepID=A0AAI8VBJ2_9PEZI|nr:Uu.00g046910.m01.CDS01 [Anthostomella pinea]
MQMPSIKAVALAFATLLACISPSAGASSSQQQPLAAGVPFEVRDAVLADVADIATTFLDAFTPAPVWTYVNQFYENYTDYYRDCFEGQVKAVINKLAPKGIKFRVLLVPDQTRHSGSRVVSTSLWEFNRTAESPYTSWSLGPEATDSGNCSLHLATNTTRADHLKKAMLYGQKTYLDGVYERHAYLHLLATHPKWDGNGFAAENLRWGMALADKMGMPTTLLATPAGYPLYRSLAFEGMYNVSVDRLDGLGTVWYEVMKFEA